MQWVEGVKRFNGRLMPIVIREDGTRLPQAPQQLDKPHLPAATRRLRLVSNFNRWTEATAKEYLSGIGASLPAEETHLVFAVEEDGLRYLIPALVLIRAMFRPLRLLADFLLRPQGLGQVCIPANDACTSVRWTLMGLTERESKLTSLQQPLAWMWAFPSAHAMWASIYGNALRGRLGLVLPRGEVEFVTHAVRNGTRAYVTSLCLTRIQTTECPYPFVKEHPGRVVFHDAAAQLGRRGPVSVARDMALRPTNNGDWSVSDAEWASIEPILEEGRTTLRGVRVHDQRALLDGIVCKLGSGVPWKKVAYKTGSSNNAAWLYQQLVKDERWSRIRQVLVEERLTPRE